MWAISVSRSHVINWQKEWRIQVTSAVSYAMARGFLAGGFLELPLKSPQLFRLWFTITWSKKSTFPENLFGFIICFIPCFGVEVPRNSSPKNIPKSCGTFSYPWLRWRWFFVSSLMSIPLEQGGFLELLSVLSFSFDCCRSALPCKIWNKLF